jgi:hypothetical protein
LDIRDREKNIYRITRSREMKAKDIGMVKYMKNDDQRILVKDEKIKKRWRSYFDRLFNRN